MSGYLSLNGWLHLGSLSWAVFRVLIVWLALYGAGSMLWKIGYLRGRFPSMPKVIFGMVAYLAAAVLMSILHILTRTWMSVLLIAGAAAGAVVLWIRFREGIRGFSLHRWHSLMLLPVLLSVYLVATNLMLAGRPEMNFNDTQVTYLVQPDRWLNEGRMFFIDETVFSAFPLTSEMLLLLPCSLSGDRLDQLVMGQLFSLSMTIALVIVGLRILGLRWRWLPAAMICVAGCSTILLWSHFAKPDGFALFFVTVSMALLYRQLREPNAPDDLSPYPVMGLALSTKLTAYPALLPFCAMYLVLLGRMARGRTGFAVRNILLTVLLPALFALRTLIHTGTLFYPHMPFEMFLKPRWRVPDVRLTYDVYNDRSSYFYPSVGFLENIYHYLGTWNSSIVLLLSGYLAILKREFLARRTLVLASILLYGVVSMVLFYPSWWGAKYGILLIPFSAFLGLEYFSRVRHGLAFATAIAVALYLIYDSPLSPTEHWGVGFRNDLVASYLDGEWRAEGLERIEEQPELGAVLWMNRHLPRGSTILSLFPTKRYFSDHRWLVLWRYPEAMGLYLENSLEEEAGIMERLGVDYVFMEQANPVPFDDENGLEILTRTGPGNLLDPVACIGGYVVLRFDPAAI